MYQGGYTGWSVPNVKMPEYNVASASFEQRSELAVGVLSETGAQAVIATAVVAAIIVANFHTLRMARIIAHVASSRQH
jgi:hypothetical protein